MGGTGYDEGGYITIDSSGSIYITGYTYSSNFPTTTGAYDTSFNGNVSYSDVFVSKMNNSLASLLASTFLGGTSVDQCSSIAIDSDGNVYLAGFTYSSNCPTTTGT